MKTIALFCCLMIVAPAFNLLAEDTAPTAGGLKIGIIGDSTVCDYPAGSKQQGWGQLLPSYFSAQSQFLNMAEKGRSTKTFPAARWQKTLEFKPDFILIQFGHNDSHEKSHPEATDAATDFRENLKRYISEARAAGAIPVLVTPVHRRTFDEAGHMTIELEPYANAMRDMAKKVNTPLVDLFAASGFFFESLGKEASEPLTMNTVSNADQPGKADYTHFTAKGAKAIAGLVATELVKVDARLAAQYLSPVATASSAPEPATP